MEAVSLVCQLFGALIRAVNAASYFWWSDAGQHPLNRQRTTTKVFAEKAITSSTYNIYLLLLDMSKSFDTVCRNKLLTDLQEVLQPDEMHMMAVLTSDVVLTVKVGKELGEQIKTEVGIAQGDCLSAVLFIFNLAKSLTPNRE